MQCGGRGLAGTHVCAHCRRTMAPRSSTHGQSRTGARKGPEDSPDRAASALWSRLLRLRGGRT
eukprot:7186107-Pyramimonas_sp.AAC.1